jgi:hypothetical protein
VLDTVTLICVANTGGFVVIGAPEDDVIVVSVDKGVVVCTPGCELAPVAVITGGELVLVDRDDSSAMEDDDSMLSNVLIGDCGIGGSAVISLEELEAVELIFQFTNDKPAEVELVFQFTNDEPAGVEILTKDDVSDIETDSADD